MKLNLALAQINTKLGDTQANLEKHLTLIKQAKQSKMDLLVFPELSLTGYVLQDLVPAVSCRPEHGDPVFRHLLDASRALDLVVGFVDEVVGVDVDLAVAGCPPEPEAIVAALRRVTGR